MFTNNNFATDYSEKGSQTSYLEGSTDYKNVLLSYVDNSATFNLDRSSAFKMLATPVSGSVWEDGTSSPKTITVNVIISNLANTIATDTFSYPITITNVDDSDNNQLLNSQLSELFTGTGNILDTFKNYLTYSSYQNVKLNYVENSADFTKKTFQLSVAPIFGSVWSDRTTTEKTITVSISKLSYIDTLKDASISADTATYSEMISGITDNNSLIEYLKTNLSLDKLKGFEAKNVSIALVESSVDYQKGLTFNVSVTPNNHHTWADGPTTPKLITVSYTCNLTVAAVPEMWSMDQVLFKENLIYAYWKGCKYWWMWYEYSWSSSSEWYDFICL